MRRAAAVAVVAVALAAALVPLWTGAGQPLPTWLKNGSSTPALLLQAYAVRARNRDAMRSFAERLHVGRLAAGRTVIVTGGTSGLGTGIVGHLVVGGARVVLPHRKAGDEGAVRAAAESHASEARRWLRGDGAAAEDGAPPADLQLFGGFDLSSFGAIERAADALAAAGVRAHALVNNAGLVPLSGRRTAEGFEAAFGVNFLGTALFTQLLADKGVLLPGARVVMVSSEEHRQHAALEAPGGPLGTPPPYASTFDAMARYGHSKLALVTYSHELARRWEGRAAVYDVCPGPVASDIARDAHPLVARAVRATLAAVFPRPAEAALPVVRLALAPAEELPDADAVHYHMSEPRPGGAGSASPEWGALVWERAQALIANRGPLPQPAPAAGVGPAGPDGGGAGEPAGATVRR